MKTIKKKTTGYKEESLKDDILKNVSTGGGDMNDAGLHIIGDKPKKIYCPHNNYEAVATTTVDGTLTNIKLYNSLGYGSSIGAALVQDVKQNDVDYYYVSGTAFTSGSGAPSPATFISNFKNYIKEPDNLQPITSIYVYKYNGHENCILNVANFNTGAANLPPTVELYRIESPSELVYEE